MLYTQYVTCAYIHMHAYAYINNWWRDHEFGGVGERKGKGGSDVNAESCMKFSKNYIKRSRIKKSIKMKSSTYDENIHANNKQPNLFFYFHTVES